MGQASTRSRLLRGFLPRAVASVVLAGGFVWVLTRGGLPLIPGRQELAQLKWWAVTAYLLLTVASTLLRAYRWLYLIRPISPDVSTVRVVGISLVGFGAIFFAPLRSGEVARPYLLAEGGDVTFMQAAGTVGAERVIDGLVVTLFTFVALSVATPVSPLPSHLGDLPLPISAVPTAVYGALVVFTSAFAAMLTFFVARAPARRLTERVVGLVSRRAATFAAESLERVADGLSFLPSRSSLWPFLLQTLGCWLLSISSQWVLLHGLDMPATFSQATTILGIQGLGSIVPAGPGMFGAYQIAGFSALAMYFPMALVRTNGALFLFVTYTSQLVLNGLQLLLGLWFMSLAKARKGLRST